MKPLHVLLVGVAWGGLTLPAIAQQYGDVSVTAQVDRLVSGHLALEGERIQSLENRIELLESQMQAMQVGGMAPAEQWTGSTMTYKPASRKVRGHETLTGIAAEYGMSVKELAAANNLDESAHLQKDQWLLIPCRATKTHTEPAPKKESKPVETASNGTYRVQKGDTLSSIATRHRVTLNGLMSANNLRNPDMLKVGQVLTIPSGATAVAPQPRREDVQYINGIPTTSLSYYQVEPGDTLHSIAQMFFTSIDQIIGLNQLGPDQVIRSGELLMVPTDRYYEVYGRDSQNPT